MACDCINFSCLEAFFNPCSEGVTLNLVANQTGNWTGLIKFNGFSTDFTIAVTSGQKIIFPTALLNENYYHQVRFFNADGNLFNDTCYSVHAQVLLNAFNTPLPPLEGEVNGITVTLGAESASYTAPSLLGREVLTIEYNSGSYNTIWTKDINSDTIYFNGLGPLPATTVLTINFA